MRLNEYREAGLDGKFSGQTLLSLLIFVVVWEVLSYFAPALGIPAFAIPSFVRIAQSMPNGNVKIRKSGFVNGQNIGSYCGARLRGNGIGFDFSGAGLWHRIGYLIEHDDGAHVCVCNVGPVRVTASVSSAALTRAELEHAAPRTVRMRQRANIIRTLVYEPEVILMDEPFGPLDAQTRLLLQNQLLELWHEERKTIVFITHDLGEAVALADRVVVMSARPGRIKTVAPVPIPRPRNLFDIHSDERFRETYRTMWSSLEEEVKKGAARWQVRT